MAITEKKSLENVTKIATEAVTHIRTVASLSMSLNNITIYQNWMKKDKKIQWVSGQEKFMIERYINEMMRIEKLIRNKIFWRGLANSLAQYLPAFAFGGMIYYASFLIAAKEIHFKNVIK